MGWTPVPKIHVTINDIPVTGLLRAAVLNTNSFAADTFTLTFALGPAPLTNAAYWSSLTSVQVGVFAEPSAGQTNVLLILGTGDAIHVDPIRSTATIEGRDLSARLIDAFSEQDFVNQTAAAIVSTLARRHGLEAVIHPTTGDVGRYYGDGYTRLTLGQFSRFQSDWDIVVHLARESGFDAYVIGSALYFQPPTTPRPVLPFTVADAVSLHVDRMVAFADPQLRVQSWNSQDMTSYSSQPPISSAGFLFGGVNLSSGQIDACAEKYAAELTRLRTILSIEMPWRLDVIPRSHILLTGTNSSFDALYVIDTVERVYCTSVGLTQHVKAVLA